VSEKESPGRWPRDAAPLVFDGLLALAMAGLSLSLLADLGVTGVPVYLLAMAHTLPIAARRRVPLAVLALGVATGLAVVLLGVPMVALGLALLVQVYTVAAYRPRHASLPALAVVEAALALAQVAQPAGVGTWAGNMLVVAVFWVLGDIVRRWRARAAELEELAAELRRAREELARKAVSEERLRIARELHDVVAHSMSTIAVQAGVGAHLIETHPREARSALSAIEVASRSALDELRRLLGVLRQDGTPGSLAPAPGLADLDALVVQVGEAGLRVRTRVEGAKPEVPASVEVSAFRIVQEALTNVLKHAGPASALVVVRYTAQDVSVEVSDDGRGGTSLAADGRRRGVGNGIAGMRERVAAFGGELEVGPRPGGGFRVAARLPFEAVHR
jgi:signal transduction histidine kinase